MNKKFDKFDISIIGSGNVATNLAYALHQGGFKINEIYSRSLENAAHLSKQIHASLPVDQLDFSQSRSVLFLIAVKDAVIASIATNAVFPEDSIVAHTSGVTNLKILSPLEPHCNTAVFYPLQTFIKSQMISFKQVPIILEASNEEVLTQLKSIAEKIGANPIELNSTQKKSLHVAAVFASNFTNRMLAAAETIVKENEMDMELLRPLIFQSINNNLNFGADQSLTGPAKRNDKVTIYKHLELLKQHPELEEVYRLLTDQIIRR